MVEGICWELKESAQGQFGGANPALLAIRLLDLTSPNFVTSHLKDLAISGPSPTVRSPEIAAHIYSGWRLCRQLMS